MPSFCLLAVVDLTCGNRSAVLHGRGAPGVRRPFAPVLLRPVAGVRASSLRPGSARTRGVPEAALDATDSRVLEALPRAPCGLRVVARREAEGAWAGKLDRAHRQGPAASPTYLTLCQGRTKLAIAIGISAGRHRPCDTGQENAARRPGSQGFASGVQALGVTIALAVAAVHPVCRPQG